jgi:hypothetical protein
MNIKIEFPEKFEVNIWFAIYINDVLYSHQICEFDGKYYLFSRPSNGIIFDLLYIDKRDFMRKFFGIESRGEWPEVDTLDKLKYQLECLRYYEEL